jgi:hypothetical protein
MNEVSFGFSQCLHAADYSLRNVVSLTQYIHFSHMKFAGISVQLRKQHKIEINKTKTVFAVV